MIGKKGYMNLLDNWVEYVMLICLVFGFFLSLVAGSKVLSVLIVFISAIIVGNNIYAKRHKFQLRIWLIILAFFIGLVAGSKFLTYKGVLVTFVIGAFLGIHMQKNKWFLSS